MSLSKLKYQQHCHTASWWSDVSGMLKEGTGWAHDCCKCCSWTLPLAQMYHIWWNLYITARVLGTSDVIIIFCQAVITIKDNSDLLRVFAKTLHTAEVVVSDLLPSLTLLPLHHVQKPSTINHQTEQDWSVRLNASVNLFSLVLEKWALLALFIFWSLLLNKDKGKGVISSSKLVSTVISHWAIIINWMNNFCQCSFPWPWESFWAMTGPVTWPLPPW